MSEVNGPAAAGTPSGATLMSGALEDVIAHATDVARSFKSEMEIPGWVAAELTFGQLRLLFKLSRSGPTSMSGIGEWLAISLPSVTGAVERLERHGLVERRHRTDDRRIVEVDLTDPGRALLVDIMGMRLGAIRRVLGLLEPEELKDLDRLLCRIIERTKGSPS